MFAAAQQQLVRLARQELTLGEVFVAWVLVCHVRIRNHTFGQTFSGKRDSQAFSSMWGQACEVPVCFLHHADVLNTCSSCEPLIRPVGQPQKLEMGINRR